MVLRMITEDNVTSIVAAAMTLRNVTRIQQPFSKEGRLWGPEFRLENFLPTPGVERARKRP